MCRCTVTAPSAPGLSCKVRLRAGATGVGCGAAWGAGAAGVVAASSTSVATAPAMVWIVPVGRVASGCASSMGRGKLTASAVAAGPTPAPDNTGSDFATSAPMSADPSPAEGGAPGSMTAAAMTGFAPRSAADGTPLRAPFALGEDIRAVAVTAAAVAAAASGGASIAIAEEEGPAVGRGAGDEACAFVSRSGVAERPGCVAGARWRAVPRTETFIPALAEPSIRAAKGAPAAARGADDALTSGSGSIEPASGEGALASPTIAAVGEPMASVIAAPVPPDAERPIAAAGRDCDEVGAAVASSADDVVGAARTIGIATSVAGVPSVVDTPAVVESFVVESFVGEPSFASSAVFAAAADSGAGGALPRGRKAGCGSRALRVRSDRQFREQGVHVGSTGLRWRRGALCRRDDRVGRETGGRAMSSGRDASATRRRSSLPARPPARRRRERRRTCRPAPTHRRCPGAGASSTRSTPA